ncbi:hypothetical protein C5167_027525 [Papaver somniferum]|uniref:uncharacterized protein LOC113339378 n=1 Tax=Papaver somniferum TaxID=3469 RepID=UPI000E6F8316|nr:uncharacterized protein LOC113339378 [Papaver somniferum]RZC91464.1 hypothetical protein C5167_027525 [Papaver somniferum]
MASSSNRMTIEELRSTHRVERQMYRRLTMDMRKEPLACMAIMALWLFMEELGYPSVISTLLTYQSDILDSALSEAQSLAHYIVTRTPPPSSLIDMPITLRLIHAVGSRRFIPLKNLFEHGTIPYIKVQKIVKDVCGALFEDIFREAMKSRNNATDTTVHSQRLFEEICGSSSLPTVEEPQAVRVITPPSEQTMLVTFSREFPITTEDHVREYFVVMHGDCIERIHMQDPKPPQRQSMGAKIILKDSETIHEILGGKESVRLLINGLHADARRCELGEGSQ